MLNEKQTPLKESFQKYWKKDMLSGFLVSIIALPLCLGIASASGFPPMMGVITAIIGGLVVSLFSGSELTIKGPAAGLIVIVAGAVEELGHGDATLGWKLALGVVVFAAILQVVLGLLKVASYADFFPITAVHGMLAAIGIIIISKQTHLALGIDPVLIKGKEPLELLAMIPESLMNMDKYIAIIGLVSLLILFGMPLIKSEVVRRIPPALIVLIVGVILGKVFVLTDPVFAHHGPLVTPGEFSFAIQADFSSFFGADWFIAVEYLFMFLLIGSLESLLTGKAIDLLDPMKRTSNLSKDLTAVGIGNVVAGLLGGLPMISEVARSSANINNGGKSRWANFFHGAFLLVFVIALVPIIKMIPVAALAAMLIYIGFRLASPKEFVHTYHIGIGQLIVFITTIIVTLATDLLVGIAAGILVELISHLVKGVPLKQVMKAAMVMEEQDGVIRVIISGSCLFTNWVGLNKQLLQIQRGKHVIVDVSEALLLDHSFMENILRYKKKYIEKGGTFELVGTENFKTYSDSPTATRKRIVQH